MARKVLISRYDRAQDPAVTITVGAGGFTAGLPAANMLDIHPQRVAQATVQSIAFTIQLGASRTIGAIHLQNFVTDVSGTVRVQAGAYDSGVVNSWATDGAGTYDPGEYAALGRPRIFVPPAPVAASTVVFTVNAGAGVAQIGFAGVCEVWEPPYSLDWGWSFDYLDESDIQTVPYGTRWFTPRGKRRRLNCGIGLIPDDRAAGGNDYASAAQQVSAINGMTAPVLIVPLPDDTATLERRALWGNISAAPKITNPYSFVYAETLQLDQGI